MRANLKPLLGPLRHFGGDTFINVLPGWAVDSALLLGESYYGMLVRVTYKLPDGHYDNKDLILRHPAPVALAVRNGQSGLQVLVVRQLRHGSGRETLELPGGMGRSGESPSATAARELREEGGLRMRARWLRLIGTIHRDPARSPGLVAPVYYVEVDANAETTAPVIEPGEHIVGRQWMPLSELATMMAAGKLTDAVLMAALAMLLARQHISS